MGFEDLRLPGEHAECCVRVTGTPAHSRPGLHDMPGQVVLFHRAALQSYLRLHPPGEGVGVGMRMLKRRQDERNRPPAMQEESKSNIVCLTSHGNFNDSSAHLFLAASTSPDLHGRARRSICMSLTLLM